MAVSIARRVFTVSEFERMAQAGILGEDDRVELIEGEIINLSPIGSRHAACVNRLNSLLSQQAGPTVIVSVQNPIRLGDYSEPQPDLALLRLRPDYYAAEHPTPGDVLLIVEVAEASADYDRTVKVPLYAEAGIPEVWLVGLLSDAIAIYTRPMRGKYQALRQSRRDESISPENMNFTLRVEAVLGEAQGQNA